MFSRRKEDLKPLLSEIVNEPFSHTRNRPVQFYIFSVDGIGVLWRHGIFEIWRRRRFLLFFNYVKMVTFEKIYFLDISFIPDDSVLENTNAKFI